MNSRDSSSCAVLLLGFRRPEFIQQRLSEIGKTPSLDVIVSIDGGISQRDMEIYSEMEINLDKEYFRFIYHDSNLGLVPHIITSITKTLETYMNVIVIEDDVKISANFLSTIAENLASSNDPRIATWGGFSPIRPWKKLENFNRWRQTPYFSAWGWGISRSAWQMYSSKLPSDDFENQLSESASWSKLSEYQKRVWKSRFRKVYKNPTFTWDYQMQYITFKYDLIHVLPVFRLVDNQGFEDLRSTNTKSNRPKWMGNHTIAELTPIPKFVPTHASKVFIYLDSFTFAGDSKLLKLLTRIQSSLKIPNSGI